MTTIAFKDGVMAADTQATAYNVTFPVQKVWRLPDGGVVACCGSASKGWAGIRWLMDGERGEPPILDDETTLVIARPDGSIWLAEGQFPAFPTLARELAHGCGRDFALSAMADGKSAVEAVMFAASQDVMTGSPVMSLQVVPQEYPEPELHYPPKPKAPRKRK